MNAQHRSDFGTFGRYMELPLDKMTEEQKRAYEFTVKQRGEVPGPYKIWLQTLTDLLQWATRIVRN